MLYADTALNGAVEPTRCGHAFFGTSSCLFATDAPFDAEQGRSLIRDTIKAVEALPITAGRREMIFAGNARALLRLHAGHPGKGVGMKTQSIRVTLRDGEMGAYLAIPDKTPAGAVIAIMEIWGVNDTMRRHAHEFAEAGFICLVPDLFWRQEPGVELSDHDPEHVKKAFDLYYDFDYDLAVRDMEDTWHYLAKLPECNGKVGAVGYCLGGKLCYLMCCRTDIDCAVAYYGTYIEHRIREAKNLHRPFVLHMAMKDRWVQAEVNDLLERRLSPNPLVTIHKYPGADHAFARHGGKTYSKPEADRALALTVEFFKQHLGTAWKVDCPRHTRAPLNRKPCRCSGRNRPPPRSPSGRWPPAPLSAASSASALRTPTAGTPK